MAREVLVTSLVFDIGGTSLRAGLWVGGQLTKTCNAPSPGVDITRHPDPVGNLLERLQAMAAELLGSGQAEAKHASAVGIAFPGPIDAAGCVQQAPTLWGASLEHPVPLADHVAEAFPNSTVRVVNDVTAAGYRYVSQHNDFCIVTVSSGIGCKVFQAGEVVVGREHRGGEIGHWRIDDSVNSTICECGGRGHLGAIASGRATPWQLEMLHQDSPELFVRSRLGLGASNTELVEAFHDGDILARAVVLRGTQALGSALALLHLGMGIERFVIFGGFAQALGSEYINLLRHSAAENGWGNAAHWRERIAAGAVDGNSGLIGMGILLDRGQAR